MRNKADFGWWKYKLPFKREPEISRKKSTDLSYQFISTFSSFAVLPSPFLSCSFGNISGTSLKFVHTKVHNGNRNEKSCLTSSEIMTLQLKVTLSFYLTFTLLRVLGNTSFTDSVALNSLSWVDLIFLLHLTPSAGCISPTIHVTHYQPTMFLVIPGNPLILTTPRSMTWNQTNLWSKPTLLLLRQLLPCVVV